MTNDGQFLIPTAEVPVTNAIEESIFEPGDVPRRYCAYSSCFRREAGSYRQDTRAHPTASVSKLNWSSSRLQRTALRHWRR